MKKRIKISFSLMLWLVVAGGGVHLRAQRAAETTQTMTGSQGIEFFHGSFDEAKAMAKKEGKLIFLDAYTAWCGPCKMMNNSTFKDAGVGEVFNEKFINLKIDMEKGEGPALSRKFQIRAYPTFLFMDAKGNVIQRNIGFIEAEPFMVIGEKVKG